MDNQWGTRGPAFEYPNCFRTENRFLTLRAALLLVLSLAIYWLALSEPDVDGSALITRSLTRGDPAPHVLMASLLLLLAGLDLWRVARQRRVGLVPGQPASLAADLMRQNKGVSSGAAWINDVLLNGQIALPEMTGPFRRLLTWLAPHAAAAPRGLWDYLGLRVAHLLWGLGLLVALALTWPLAGQPGSMALAALFYGGAAAALVARSAWLSHSAPSFTALLLALLLVTSIGMALAWFGAGLLELGRLAQMGLPLAALVLLSCLLLIEGLALLAGRIEVDSAPKGRFTPVVVKAELKADSERVMQELERELHRYWVEGIPNRRHAWYVRLEDGEAGAATVFSAKVLEETQPTLPQYTRARPPNAVGARWLWLLVLLVLGLLLTLGGGALWVMLAAAQMDTVGASWVSAATSLVLVVAGGHALRIGHLLWSRFEVESTLVSVEGRASAGAPPMAMSWAVARARSVFYAAADHVVGGRTLLELRADVEAARRR